LFDEPPREFAISCLDDFMTLHLEEHCMDRARNRIIVD